MCCGSFDFGPHAGNGFCCPSIGNMAGAAKCWACPGIGEYRCYQGIHPPVCTTASSSQGGYRLQAEGEMSFIGALLFFALFFLICVGLSKSCSHRRPLAGQMEMAGVTSTGGLPCATAVPAGSPVQGMPVGTARPYPGGAAYPGAYGDYDGHGYGRGGYGGGDVAMGAGMGFLGGMVLADMVHDMGHSGCGGGGGGGFGGGDVGGGFGGDFAADM